jgi:hypothetical protein
LTIFWANISFSSFNLKSFNFLQLKYKYFSRTDFGNFLNLIIVWSQISLFMIF